MDCCAAVEEEVGTDKDVNIPFLIVLVNCEDTHINITTYRETIYMGQYIHKATGLWSYKNSLDSEINDNFENFQVTSYSKKKKGCKYVKRW